MAKHAFTYRFTDRDGNGPFESEKKFPSSDNAYNEANKNGHIVDSILEFEEVRDNEDNVIGYNHVPERESITLADPAPTEATEPEAPAPTGEPVSGIPAPVV